MKVVSQTEIQKMGGECSRFPVSCLIRDMLIESGILKPFKTIEVLDLTFGEGRFWGAIPQARVWGFDIRKLKWYKKPYVFFMESCENWKKHRNIIRNKFDLVVVDPPFTIYKQRREHYEDGGMLSMILNEGRKASEYFNVPLLVHFMWKCVPYGFKVVTERWFLGVTRYLNIRLPTWFGLLSPEVG